MGLWDSIAGIWERIPQRLQQAIAIGVSVMIVVVGMMLVWLLWGSGYFHEQLGIPVTKDDFKQQTEQLHLVQEDLVMATVQAAIAQYDSSIQEHLRTKEEDARRTILQPILNGMQALKSNQEMLMRSQSNTNQQMQAMPQVFDRKLDRLIEETNHSEQRKRERELLEELLRRTQEEDDQPPAEETPKPKRRTSIKL